jgi:hypothetical protein
MFCVGVKVIRRLFARQDTRDVNAVFIHVGKQLLGGAAVEIRVVVDVDDHFAAP